MNNMSPFADKLPSEDKIIPVMAKISNLELWKELSYITHGVDIKSDNDTWIVTAGISSSDFPKLKKEPFVLYIEYSHPCIDLLQNG